MPDKVKSVKREKQPRIEGKLDRKVRMPDVPVPTRFDSLPTTRVIITPTIITKPKLKTKTAAKYGVR